MAKHKHLLECQHFRLLTVVYNIISLDGRARLCQEILRRQFTNTLRFWERTCQSLKQSKNSGFWAEDNSMGFINLSLQSQSIQARSCMFFWSAFFCLVLLHPALKLVDLLILEISHVTILREKQKHELTWSFCCFD